LYLNDEITDDDVTRVRQFGMRVAADPKGYGVVYLNSPGGRVGPAMAIGRLMRQYQLEADVLENNDCASSCVLVLAGAITRVVDGRVGIHRPYFDTREIVDVKQSTTRLENDTRAYFREMNVSTRLVNEMMTVPSNQIRWLTSTEITRFGLHGTDPVFHEASVLSTMRQYGISRQEYERRDSLGETKCRRYLPREHVFQADYQPWIDCKELIYRNGW
jgi:hypothetical protein